MTSFYDNGASTHVRAVYVVPKKKQRKPEVYKPKNEVLHEILQQIQLLGTFAFDGPGIELIFRNGHLVIKKIPGIGPKLMNDLKANHDSIIHYSKKLEQAIGQRNALLKKQK